MTVKDRFGLTDTATKTIEIKPAVPTAFFRWTGTPKENRKVIFDSSESYGSDRYPLDFSRNQWEFIPPTGVPANAIKIVTSPDLKTRQVLFKEPGDYRVRLAVKNTKGTISEWYEQVVTVYPDQPPVADFYTIKTITRDPANANKAAIALMDRSYSPDGDVISQRVWKYRYDSNNDGRFSDETWVTLENANNPTPVLYTNQVGKYEFRLSVEESFGEETILEFISSADMRTGDTSAKPLADRTVEVINLGPVVNFDVIKKKKADILFVTGKLDSRDAKYSSFQGNLAAFRNILSANSIDANIIQADATGSMEVTSREDSSYLYYYIGGTVEPKYVVRVNKSGSNTGGMIIYRREVSTGNLVGIIPSRTTVSRSTGSGPICLWMT
ncbi:MAG: domain containing protein [Peptococcaceae bacterium]|nr:domain containing protein [Peptococcaceae bacterium]